MAQKYRSEGKGIEGKAAEETSLLNTYGRQHVSFVSGKGCTVTDSEGKEYVDFVAGLAVNSLGYAHPRLVAAICNQANSIIHTSNLYEIDWQRALAGRLASKMPAPGCKVFFCNSGAEANEAAIKFAFKATGRSKIIAMTNSFHGRTALTLSVTCQERYWKGFEHLLNKNVSFAEYGSAESVIEKLDDDVACIIMEPIQGEGGVVVPPEGFLTKVSEAARANGTLLIMDEVQTGMGRTGKFFCHSWEKGCVPDIVTMAKALAGGLPIGAAIVSSAVASAIKPGDHGSTFGGNQLCSAAANAALDVVEGSGFMDAVQSRGESLMDGLRSAFSGAPFFNGVRGKGLMIGIDMTKEAADAFKKYAFERGYLVNVTHEHIVRLIPPLVIGDEEIEGILKLASSFASSYHPSPQVAK